MIAGERVLSKLNGRVRHAAGPRVDEADRLHRTEAQRVATAMRHHFDRQAALEEFLFVEVVDRRGFRGHDAHRRSGRILSSSAGSSDNRPHHRRRQQAAPESGADRRDLPQRDARNTFSMSIVSARTIGLMAS